MLGKTEYMKYVLPNNLAKRDTVQQESWADEKFDYYEAVEKRDFGKLIDQPIGINVINWMVLVW